MSAKQYTDARRSVTRRSRLNPLVEPCERRQLLATVAGTIFNDANRNGRLDAGESGLGARTVFADYNYNGVVDGSDPIAVTDAGGKYTLTTRSTNVSVRVATRPGESVSLPYGATGLWFAAIDGAATGKHIGIVSANRFAARFRVFADYNGNGALDANEQANLAPSTGFSGWLDRDGNTTQNAAGGEISIIDFDGLLSEQWSVNDLAPGTYTFRFKANRPNTGLTTGATAQVTIGTADVTTSVGLSGIGQAPWVILFSDANGNGVQDAGETTLNSAWAGRSLFFDRNNDGVRQASEDLVDLASQFGVQTTYTGSFKIAGLQAGETFTTSSSVVIDANSASKTVLIGVKLASTSVVTGAVFGDANGNGKLDAGESRLSNRTVFADYNYNGRLDAGEATAVTDINGNYTIATRATNVSLRVALGLGESISLPYGATSIWLATVNGTLTGKHLGVR